MESPAPDRSWRNALNKKLPFPVPEVLVQRCISDKKCMAWLHTLPLTVSECLSRWSLTPYALLGKNEATCSYVMKVRQSNGQFAVAKFAYPHMEGKHEIAGLQFWHGDGVVQLYAADEQRWAMLMENCSPGTSLRHMPEHEQDVVIAQLLQRLWQKPLQASYGFRCLNDMLQTWFEEARQHEGVFYDPGLLQEAISLSDSLWATRTHDVLLATDLHAGNVLKAQREPWLVIDPKPFIGDCAYDATQHMLNSMPRLISEPIDTIERFATLLGVDAQRVRQWMFVRLVIEVAWNRGTPGAEKKRLIRRLAP